MREPLAEEPAPGSRFPAAFRPPAFASRVFLRPLGDSASLTVGLPADTSRRTPSGLSRSACDRYDRGGRPLNPGDGGALPASQIRPAGTRRLPAAGPCSPACCNPPARVLMTRRHRGFTHVHPSGLPQPVTPGWNRSPWALPGLRTPQSPAAHAGAGTVLAHWTGYYAVDISQPSFDRYRYLHATSCRTI